MSKSIFLVKFRKINIANVVCWLLSVYFNVGSTVLSIKIMLNRVQIAFKVIVTYAAECAGWSEVSRDTKFDYYFVIFAVVCRVWSGKIGYITKTCLYNVDPPPSPRPLKPHFYIVKLGFIGVYIIFLISAQKRGLMASKLYRYVWCDQTYT